MQQWLRAGGGTAGRKAAERYLERNFSDESKRTRDAVLNRVSDSIRAANNRKNTIEKGTDRAIQKGDVPDLANLQRRSGARGDTVVQVRLRVQVFDPETMEQISESTIIIYGELGQSVSQIIGREPARDAVSTIVQRLVRSPKIKKDDSKQGRPPIVRETVQSITTVVRP